MSRLFRRFSVLAATAPTIMFGIATFVEACVGDDPNTTTGPAGGTDASAPIEDADAQSVVVSDADANSPPRDANGVCDPDGVFGPPTFLANLNTSFGDHGARLTPDELTVYFSSARGTSPASYDLYAATRTNINGAFGTPTRLAATSMLNADDGYPTISPDELELFLSRATSGVDTYDIYVARRGVVDAAFGAATSVSAANVANVGDLEPFVAPNRDLYFSSYRRAATGAAADIFYISRFLDGGFGAPTPIDEVATSANDGWPVLSFDMLTLYWGSTRPDNGGDVTGDIWRAHRASVNAPFEKIQRVTELNAPGKPDYPSWLSADNCRLYFSSQRSGPLQIYLATREP